MSKLNSKRKLFGVLFYSALLSPLFFYVWFFDRPELSISLILSLYGFWGMMLFLDMRITLFLKDLIKRYEENGIFRFLYTKYRRSTAVTIQLIIEGIFVLILPSLVFPREFGVPLFWDYQVSAIFAGIVGVLGISFVSDAEALKGKGVGISQYGSATDVCGLVLCSDYPGGKEAYRENWSSSFANQVSESAPSQQIVSEPAKMIRVSAYNVDEEYPAQLDTFIHKFELDKISSEEAIVGIKEVHEDFTGLYIQSDVIDTVSIQINIYESGNDSAAHVLEEIHEMIEEKETELSALHSVDGEAMVKELPPNTVDMPVGAGVPGCEENDMCYTPGHLTVPVGTTVTWINSDGAIPHTVTAGWPDSDSVGLDYPGGNGFDSDFMSGGATYEHTFEVPGEYDYYCLHPWMLG